MLLGREQILHAEDLQFEEVEAWGGVVRVRMMTGSERDSFEQSMMKVDGAKVTRDMANMRAKLLIRTICDENNKRVFTDKDIDLVGGKSAAEIEKVFEAAQRLNKLAAQDSEEQEKNSEGEGKGISTSASPEN
jgi:hypothetical protein